MEGHRHLHFEVNEFHEGKTRALRNAELWSLIRSGEHTRVNAP
jgi:hypothetical protein